MPDPWDLLDADAEERRWFANLDATLARISGPAAPPNRHRQVHRIAIDGRTWYLKEFRHTQWKNRWRSRLTAPRCALDGDRERLVAAALRERGIPVARPVAAGRRGGASFYLCAELPGAPILHRFREGDLPRGIAFAAARFGGGILAAGVVLPDLSAEHLYHLPDSGTFAVIDLHNGRLAPRPTRRDAVRILRRFARSVRGAPVPRPLALGFAVRLLAAAGMSSARRREVIERVPPMETHGRYEVAGRSAAYRRRNPGRTARELTLLERVLPEGVTGTVLDTPAGAGRLGPTLRRRFARRIAADRAMAMLREGRGAGDPDPMLQADATALPLGDRSVDGVVVFRFLHHLEPEAARVVLAEAARVAAGFVVVSFFHPVSLHGVTRRIRGRLQGRPATRYPVTLGRLRRWMAELGFAAQQSAADLPYLRDFWVATFTREP